MEREFVPYELAMKLKELGFDEPCLFAFDNCSTPMRCSDLRTNDQKFNGVNYNSSTYTSQPTFSQAFRWFRKKHNLNAISPTLLMYTTNVWAFRIIDLGTSEDVIGCRTANSHEEAEQACLDKLIETVETKSE